MLSSNKTISYTKAISLIQDLRKRSTDQSLEKSLEDDLIIDTNWAIWMRYLTTKE